MSRTNANLCAVWWQYIYPITALTILVTLGLSFFGLTTGIALPFVVGLLFFGLFVFAPVTAILSQMGLGNSEPVKWLPTGPRVDEPADDVDPHVMSLRERYVAGKISEEEFERQLDQHFDENPTARSESAGGLRQQERELDR